MFISFFRDLETEKTRSLTRIEILDHADTELVSRFLMDRGLCESFSLLRLLDLKPFGMIRIHDELAFDFEIGGHDNKVLLRFNCMHVLSKNKNTWTFKITQNILEPPTNDL